MKRLSPITAVLLMLVALAGCALPGSIVPNATTADELVKKLGNPTDKRPNPNGGEFWEYAYGPTGTETWLFGIDRSRKVSSAEQLLAPARLSRVIPGTTTQTQVRELFGRPGNTALLRGVTSWEWRVEVSPNVGLFIVLFDQNGIVTGAGLQMDSSMDSDEPDGT